MQFYLSSATLSSKYRGRIREKYNLLEEPLSDYATHCLLGPCALCQEYRELKYNNVDLGICPPARLMLITYFYVLVNLVYIEFSLGVVSRAKEKENDDEKKLEV